LPPSGERSNAVIVMVMTNYVFFFH
jgi:hypothetical protein